jgi:3-oxoacyl-[acyl-carrier-protein] synthase-3
MTKQLRNIPRPKGSKVSGIGVYRPTRIVRNDEIAPLIDSSDQWIRERSGIIERRYANSNETVAVMAINACNEAIKDSGINPLEIDLVILAGGKGSRIKYFTKL